MFFDFIFSVINYSKDAVNCITTSLLFKIYKEGGAENVFITGSNAYSLREWIRNECY